MFNFFKKIIKNSDTPPLFSDRSTAFALDTFLIFMLYYIIFMTLGGFNFGEDYMESQRVVSGMLNTAMQGGPNEQQELLVKLLDPNNELAGSLVTFAMYKYLEQALILGPYLVGFTYFLGTTPGKYLFNMHVVDAIDGSRVSFIQSVMRFMAMFLCMILPILLIPSIIIFLASKNNILLHDYMANTKVLYNDENNFKKLLKKLKKDSN